MGEELRRPAASVMRFAGVVGLIALAIAAFEVARLRGARSEPAAAAEAPRRKAAMAPEPLPQLAPGSAVVIHIRDDIREDDRLARWASIQGQTGVVYEDPAEFREVNEVFKGGIRPPRGDRWVMVKLPDEPLFIDGVPLLRSELVPVPAAR